MVYKARGRKSIFFHEMLSTPYAALEQNGFKLPESLLEIPGPTSHPVLIARYMLCIATFLQHLHPNILGVMNGLSETPHALMKRLAETANTYVTTNEEFFGSIEALECIMMESMYLANGGNLRRSWMANRRAMVTAQLMNLHRVDRRAQYKVLDHKTRADPQFMWFRIVFHDRHLCLMLGLTQGSLDRSMATGTAFRNDSPMGRLERMHCTIASQILERNESDPSFDNFALTQNLDIELQKAGRSLPSKWWLMPNLNNVADNPQDLFWDMGRLFNQLYHYNLLNQLHLPYMLRSSPERKYEYSRMTCVNASREVLLRFIMFRSYTRTDFCCRTVDFFALMAAITLLLAHLDSHRFSQTSNLLAHQYLSDRAMIEQAQVNMEQISQVNGDNLSAQSAHLLQKLLAVESETANGISMESVSVESPESEILQPSENDDGVLRVQIPYFGILKIARQGTVSKEIPSSRDSVNGQSDTLMTGMLDTGGTEAGARTLNHDHSNEDWYPGPIAEGDLDSVGGVDGPHEQQFAPRYPDNVSDTFLQQYQDPGLTAGIDDWAFQGVDMAFFDSLMKGVDDGNDSETQVPGY